jgi:hypothetical protein
MSVQTARRVTIALAVSLVAALGFASPAAAAEPVAIVHQEQVVAGPYELVLGFSQWPLKEGRSFDLLVDPNGGIAGKSGAITVVAPNGEAVDSRPLSRFPRQRESWGLDVVSFVADGTGGRWSVTFEIDGPRGHGQGRLAALPMEPKPGPPDVLSWLIATIPALLLGATIAVGWFRIRPGRRAGSWSLTETMEPSS